MASTPRKRTAAGSLTPISDRNRVEVKVKVPKTENILFIGSEMYYDLFWLKMMFIGAAYCMTAKMRSADRLVIAYVDEGYTHMEKLAIDQLASQCEAKALGKSVEVQKLGSSGALTRLLNREREDYKLLDVFFASHGVVGAIDLNYQGNRTVKLATGSISSIASNAFAVHGRLFSYACRTGVSIEDAQMGFKSEADAKPEASLAQKMADHFGIEVHAFLRRSFYGDVLRDKSQSDNIVKALVEGREAGGDAAVIPIPPEHEGLPHAGLANRWGRVVYGTIPTPGIGGPLGEGTDNFALWRKKGGRTLPTAGDSPTGLGSDMRVFRPGTQ